MSNVAFIKNNADIPAIIKHLDVGIVSNGDSLRGPCPIHGGSNPSAFSVNPNSGKWYCHTQCKRGGDIIELVQSAMDLRFYEACELIARVSGFTLNGINFSKEEISQYEEAKRWFGAFKKPFVFDDYDLSCQETYPVDSFRGLTKETLKSAGVFFSRTFNLSKNQTKQRVGFPIVFGGKLIGVDLRATRVTDTIKWLRQPTGLSIGHALYGYDAVAEDESSSYIVLVEGIIDALKLIQLGYPALCTFGASITDEQATLIENLGVDVYVAYDGDIAGYKGVNNVYQKLHKKCNIFYINIPAGEDPDSISADFDILFESAKMMREELKYEV